MSNYAVQMLKVGEFEVPGPELFWMSGWDQWFPLVCQVGVIRGNGLCALINSGPADDLNPMNDHWEKGMGKRVRMHRLEGWFIIDQLRRIGVKPEDVTHIILTPLQLYTTSNVDRFPNAQICLSKKGWLFFNATHNHPHDVRWQCIPKHVFTYMTVDAWDRVRLLEDEDCLVPGLRTWWAGSHHRATIAVEIDSTVGKVVASDAFFYYKNVEDNHPIGISENIYESMSAHKRAKDVADHIIPLYDPLVFAKYADGIVAPL